MSLPHRIAAGGIVFRGDSVLLVRYPGSREGETYLAGPGGGLEDGENIVQAVTREIREETGLTVAPQRVIGIEDILFPRFKMVKIWMLCEAGEGDIRRTEGAEIEGIVEAAWFTRDQLAGETVYPDLLLGAAWDRLREDSWPVAIPPSRTAFA
jgi:ADP-ribose pyrophosphatase YjhB (NUDIX family)